MIKKDFRLRLVNPVLVVFVVMFLSFIGYFGSRHVDNAFLHQIMAALFGSTYFLSIAFGTIYVFTTAYLRGASLHERILISFVNPFLWMSKEVFRLTESHPLIECPYWYLNPLNIWLICLMTMEMGIGTLLARSILRRRGEEVNGSRIGPIAVILGSIFFVVSLYAWGAGENVYVLFLRGYRLLFGSGI